ncbi:molecular chaperone HtpG [Roseivirga pacifica]|uniref:molecular chaperone HtpG n=1 Tax=Roseivirga pacifica TaxID=1267423 RepID=UPI0020949782|nr:molecular chaperone HtpG [Roseivirga pacifica]MCO6359972.1 molecular chaperone HtpG [Roseivirga pacifica]MCO6367342.1 molecular chaperone HtpG [Roseivirga pacifica]MCO6370127.1 molecular chaperone HtpG [Roseivirga pacifica]MCO6374999.1 molecular chaperone HtpG [Roseivirga pacifica]MCO6380257.1 molecular chaperone HtpG [Roseivirga pacifica]
MQEKGTISIHTENIFPIIKKFLYSDHEIFLRELVSNAVDATQKVKRLASLGEYTGDLGETRVEVSVNKKKKTITISDAGIGMTAEEIKKYINQIAFSGATEFVEKFKDAGDAKEIIGKFGLGFYSAFMVAGKVEIDSLSYQEGAEPAKWICDGSTEFEITEGKRKTRGTTITLHVNDDSEEFLEDFRIQQILDKYAKFLPIEVKFGEKDEQVEDGTDKEGKPKYKTVKKDNIINNTDPIWTKSPADLTDEDYLNFYKELYPFSEDPLFWIHLNVDYPFELTGILYFPKLKNDFEMQKNKIQLYSRQVFITDEVKDVVPEFLMLLHGIIDSPDIPLNVSRSYLQSDGNVKKINSYITKKVADKLGELFKKERESYESKWDDIGLFVKYGMISEEKFYDKAKDFALVKNVDGKCFTIEEYEKHIEANQTDKDKNKIWLYASNPAKQDSFISAAKDKGYDVLVLDSPIDSHFVNHMEQQLKTTQVKRVDADNLNKLIDKDEKPELVLNDEQKESLKGVFEKAIDSKTYTVNVDGLSPNDAPVTVTMPEFMRRMKEMQATGGGGGFNMFGAMPDNYEVTVNGNHPLADKILKADAEEAQGGLAKQAFDLALLSQGLLEGKDLTDFIKRSTEILGK